MMLGAFLILLVGIVLAVLVCLGWIMLDVQLSQIFQKQEAIMAAIDDAAAANAEKANALEAKINETIGTLKELKDLVGTGTTANAEAALAETNAKLDTLLAGLGAAEDDADPTPDA